MSKKKLKKKEVEEELVKVKRKLLEVCIIVDRLSRQVGNFEDSKPLNVLYKELNALQYTVGMMCGRIEKQKVEELEKFLWRVPDCLKVWLANH